MAGSRNKAPSSKRSSKRRSSRRPQRQGRHEGSTAPSGSGAASPQAKRYEAEVLPGLGTFAADELAAMAGVRLDELASTDRIPFRWTGDGVPPADALRTVTALQRVVTFDVPRPKGLLGDAAFRELVGEVRQVIDRQGPFEGLRVEAAGRDSAVFVRLRRALADALATTDDPEAGELRLRVRPDPDGASGGDTGAARRVSGSPAWQVLIRTTPRPLSARSWRVHNRAGGLNACVAAAVWRWLGYDPNQRILNAMCGSGTLAIERAALGPYARLVGVDLDVEALDEAAVNARAAGLGVVSDVAGAFGGARDGRDAPPFELKLADVTASNDFRGDERSDAAFDVFVADPPWGDALGDVGELPEMYGRLLREAARQVAPGGQALIVTHALRVFEAALDDAADSWEPNGVLRVFHGGHRPALFRLKRRA